MANYIKSFNFRSGVQVDNDNFVVNPNGLVGIGTTLPSEVLDVRGNAKVVGHLTATDASVSGIVTVGSITINGSTGTISATTFSGSAGQSFGNQAIVAIATDGLIAGATGLTTTSNLGVNTTSTAFELQVGSDPTTATGFGVTEGNITASGNLKISGVSTTATLVVTGLSTTKDFEVTGVSTIATLGVTGLSTTKDFEVTGVSTIATLGVTGLTTTKNFEVIGVTTVGFITASSLQVAGVSTLGIVTASNIYSTGIVTATSFVGTLTGSATSLTTAKNFSITGDLEASAVSFNGEGNVALVSTLSNSFSANTTGIITAATVVSSGIGSFNSIGIQTSSPSVDLQIRKASGESKIEVISDTGTASISIGNSVGTGNSSASINYGSVGGFGVFSASDSFNIIQRDSGYFNYFLPATATDSAFVWHKGSSNQLMSLTHDGNLGIGKTNPAHKLHVQGISTFTGSAHFNNNVTIDGTLTIPSISASLTGNVTGNVTGNLSGNVNTTTGISTFNNIKSAGVGIGTTSPRCVLDLEEATDNTTGFVLFPSRTTAGRNNISPVGSGTTIEGSIIYNSTNKRLEFYNGTGWVGVTTEA
jgi:hypothetical protein